MKKIYPAGHVKKKIGYFPTLGGGGGGLRKVGIFQLFFFFFEPFPKIYLIITQMLKFFEIYQDIESLDKLVNFKSSQHPQL